MVKKLVGQVGFVGQPKRRVVERTTASSEAFVKVTMIHLMVRRLKT